ncbi:hypothetical protein F5Y16DRAFT_233248 [Xylariaceae sp. FL0255]|nr:hypothetical protein F5Y16DRAFT_233248 [Xylariaceae sp. FL0255]
MAIQVLLDKLGPEIEDPEEETFLLFSQEIPSQNLGFVDSKATTIDLTIGGNDYTINQSPTILNRPGSTTGAVIWKITPLLAEWFARRDENLLWTTGALRSESCVLELGCGISGLVGLVLSGMMERGQYVLTDQQYVARLVEKNIEENRRKFSSKSSSSSQNRRGKSSSSSVTAGATSQPLSNLRFSPLDWELDEVNPSLTGSDDVDSFDAIIACDCIYNDTLIRPLVQTCADACRLRVNDSHHTQAITGGGANGSNGRDPTICIVAQQLRDPEIFEGWIKEFSRLFRVWRVPEGELSRELRANTGFVVHVGILKEIASG